jgi:transposase
MGHQKCYNEAYMGHPFNSTETLQANFINYFKEIGLIAPACKKTGISRSTFHRWINAKNDDGIFSCSFGEAVSEVYDKHKKLWKKIPEKRRNWFIRVFVDGMGDSTEETV